MKDEHASCQCGVCKVEHFERNNYFHGKTLTARDLKAEQEYFNEKRWLLNRMVVGWGVVCGLDVCLENGCLSVRPGLALDCCGHELLVCEEEKLGARAFAEQLGVDPCGKTDPVRWALCLEYRECRVERVRVPSSCEPREGHEYNRIRDGYKLTVRRFEDACPEDQDEHVCAHEGLGRITSIQRALWERARKCHKCEDCECVLLAIGTLKTEPEQPPQLQLDPEGWKWRRLVYTNPALGDLLRCLHPDLAHIQEMNWKPGYHYDVDTFLDLLSKQHLKVKFDKPMLERTVKNPRSCRLSVYVTPEGDNCPGPVLIPVDHVEYFEADHTAVYHFDDDCIQHELRTTCKRQRKSAEVELILHGSMIHDKNGRALDAELIEDFPTGNGVEAGEFIAYFTVGP